MEDREATRVQGLFGSLRRARNRSDGRRGSAAVVFPPFDLLRACKKHRIDDISHSARFLFLIVLLFALHVHAQQVPVLLYSDLDSGPATGGEGGTDGAFVCVYGEHFGATQGVSSLTIAATEVSAYKVWTDAGAPYLPGHYAKACGQISRATPNGTQNIVLTTSAGKSNALTFTVRSGRVYFASTSGIDSNPGTASQPFATLKRCKNALSPGDICYVHATRVTALDNYSSVLWLGAGGSSGNPIAIVAYPGETVTVDGSGSPATSRAIFNYAPGGRYVGYFTVAGLALNGYLNAFIGRPGSYIRFVDNDIECTGGGCAALAAGFGGSGDPTQSFDHVTVLGNRFHDIGCHDENDSSRYMDYSSAPHPCAWINSGSITAYTSGTTMYLAGSPTGWSAPNVLQITYAGNTDIVRPVRSPSQPYCTELANYLFDCATKLGTKWQLTLDHPLTADIPKDSAVPFQYRIYAPAKTEHNVYFGAFTFFLNFGWNEIDGSAGQACRGFQIFHNATAENNHDLLIHDNYIHDTTCDAINLNSFDATCGPVQVYNNLIVRAGKGISDIIADPPGGGGNNAAIYMSGSGTPGAPRGAACSAYPDQLEVFNNTIVNSGITGAQATMQWPSAKGTITRSYNFYDPSTQLILTNNIFVQPAGATSPYYTAYQKSTANTAAQSNLCYGSGGCPVDFTNSLSADPLFANEGAGQPGTNYHLQEASPAVRFSSHTPLSVTDQDGMLWTSPYTVGAYQTTSANSTSGSPDFTITAGPASATITRGESATFTITVTPQSHFDSATSFNCAGLPAFAVCAFSPASLIPNGGPATATLTITTTAVSSDIIRPAIRGHGTRPIIALWLSLPLVGIMVGSTSKRPSLRLILLLAIAFVLLTAMVACVGVTAPANISGGSAPATSPSTSAATSQVQITATAGGTSGQSATISHSTTVTLTVQ